MLEIVPAIIPKDFRELEEKLGFISGTVDSVQIDVTDGKFAGKASWPYLKKDENFESIIREERGMPYWEEFDFEIDMMVLDPLSLAKDWIMAGAARIVFHVEALNLERDTLLLEQMQSEGLVQIGMAINPETEIGEIEKYIQFADFVQVMGISEIGFQGHPFDQQALELIKEMRKNYPNMIIAVDGAMNDQTIPLVLDAGADRVIVGSYIFESVNPRETIAELQAMI